jgi:subtilisin-like proprotein convertase family protein/phosphotransferase system HPr-like phosphotransfer protein
VVQSLTVVTGYWSEIDEVETPAPAPVSPKLARDPAESRLLKLNLNQLQESLKAGTSTHIRLPDPYGGEVEFVLKPSSVMPKQLAARYPNIRSFEGVSIHDRSTTVRLELTSKGLSAQVLTAGERWVIDPVEGLGPEFVRSYRYSKGYQSKSEPFCELETSNVLGARSVSKNQFTDTVQRGKSTGTSLRTYRLAVATTGEYGAYHGGTIEDALSAVVVTINRVDGIFETELAINLELIATNDDIVFADPLTDPFAGNDNAGTLIDESQAQIDLLIGTENYDVGHTLSTGAGGLAGLGVVCREGGKAEGVTGSTRPEGDFFDVDFVAHELGHQFAAEHTWNGANGGCGVQQRATGSAYEPGSGSSIMSYAGLCGSDNIATAVDALFHHQSFEQIVTYTREGIGSVCGQAELLENTAPQVDAGSDYVVPKQTPLVVTGSATDEEQDALLFSWEQRDLGPQAALTNPDDGRFALFRMLDSASSPQRYLPALTTVVSGTQDASERIPQVAREMTMRLTAKDGAGGVQSDDIVVTVDGDSGPFEVVSPNGGEQVGSSKTVEWDTGFTEQAPVSASMVEIYLSTNDGVSFDQLIDTVDNMGSANLNFPAGIQSQEARLMIKGAGNIFYDVSDAAFQLDSDRAVPPIPALDRVEAGDTKLTLYFEPGVASGVVADTYEAYCATESIATETDYAIEALLPFDENTPITSELEITDDFIIEKDGLRVPIDINHEYRGDVQIELQSPAGNQITLKDGGVLDNTLDVIETYPVSAEPVDSLDAFIGESTKGTWTLDVSDLGILDVGTLNEWGITVVSRSSASEGTASGASSPLVIEGLINGETYECTLTPFAEGWPGERVSFPPAIPVGADGNSLTPSFAALTSTAEGFTMQVSNYNAEFTWDVVTTAGSASINGTGLITVIGLGAGQSATVTVTASRVGFNDGSAAVIGNAATGAALAPEFDAPSSNVTGFTVQVSNYDVVFVWEVSASTGSAAINDSGLITVSGLAPSQSATVNVTTSRTGYESGIAEISGSADVGAALTPEFNIVVSTADGFTVQVSNYDSGFSWELTPTAGTASIEASGLITVVGLTSGQNSVVTVTTTRSGYERGSADVSGSANETGSTLNIAFAVTDLSSTTFEEGDGDRVVLAFTVQAEVADAQINGMTLAASGDLNDVNEVGAVKVFADANDDGVADASELVSEGAYTTDNGSISFTFDNALPITTESRQVLITYEF